ncbi:phosphoenolpyruvate synthase [Pollutibacter soli]|uniref:phosphoenolpyruvate synthase n=1 Tax=Pollutibacter soli TaxID=3034157 RepID=UPI00301415C6
MKNFFIASRIEMSLYTLSLHRISKNDIGIVGGKASNLGELAKIDGIQVPGGFCITTNAFRRIVSENKELNALFNLLGELKADERKKITEISAQIRSIIENIFIPDEIKKEIAGRLMETGEKNAFAIRSSATAEDLPTASFAGQQDTYLNIIGENEILKHISKCWASLFTERAISYRIQNDFDHRKVYLAVIVQKMIFSDVSGILFTADPVTSNRQVVAIDASFGLGEALVSGLVNADNYKIRKGTIIDKKITSKTLAVYADAHGGTKESALRSDFVNKQVLTDEQILYLERIARRIEEHFDYPQDIEWCLAGDQFFTVQSRPITTLFPIPGGIKQYLGLKDDDRQNRAFVSVGHQQMMTDAMRPLGLSIWNMTSSRSMFDAAGRLFVDITSELESVAKRNVLVNVLGKNDLLTKDALITLMQRDDFITIIPEQGGSQLGNKAASARDFQELADYDPQVVPELIRRGEEAIAKLKQEISSKSGVELMKFIEDDFKRLTSNLWNPQSFGVIMTGMNAASWINEKTKEWLNENNAADVLSQSLPNNVTSEMGLALMDVADEIRPYPNLVGCLQNENNKKFPENLLQFQEGKRAYEVIQAFLEKYGMRCAGEIDITKTRWSEDPLMIIPAILNNVRIFTAGAGQRKFEQGKEEAIKKEQQLLDRLKQLPDGEQKAKETKRMIGLLRNLSGYREYPKYNNVCHYFIYKQALLKEAESLVRDGLIREEEDIYYLSFEELRRVIARNSSLDSLTELIQKRKEEFRFFEKLQPPRVITSDGEIITGKYNRENLPADAIPGLPVSSGVVEGRARVILNMENAELEEGDILVTAFTDPSWTPLFVSVRGLVTEVGGLMTHGAVIAREYGLPAVVAVENATEIIKDGQRIVVNGTEGWVRLSPGKSVAARNTGSGDCG